MFTMNRVVSGLLLCGGICITAMAAQPDSSSASANSGAFGDWQKDSPGVKHHIQVKDLPAPFATKSAGNGPSVVSRPSDAKLSVPAHFAVETFATGLNNPRIVRVAPNGDIFVAETGP